LIPGTRQTLQLPKPHRLLQHEVRKIPTKLSTAYSFEMPSGPIKAKSQRLFNPIQINDVKPAVSDAQVSFLSLNNTQSQKALCGAFLTEVTNFPMGGAEVTLE